MKILIADDHHMFRDAIVHFIERSEPQSDIILAKDINDVMSTMQSGAYPDLVLLDLWMPGMNGMQGLARMRELYPRTPVAIISGFAERQDVEKALELGAVGYFPKTLSGRELIDGMKQIMKGNKFVPRLQNTDDIMPSHFGLAGRRASDRDQNGNDHEPSAEILKQLTPREREVLSFLMKGMSNKEIARSLGLQEVTIKLHVRGICRKLKAKNRTQAVLIAQGRAPDPHVTRPDVILQ